MTEILHIQPDQTETTQEAAAAVMNPTTSATEKVTFGEMGAIDFIEAKTADADDETRALAGLESALSQGLTSLRQRLTQRENVIRSLEGEISRLQTMARQGQQDLEQREVDFFERLSEMSAFSLQLEQRIHELEREAEGMIGERDTLSARLEAATNELQTIQERLAQKQQELEGAQAKAEAHDQEFSALEHEFDNRLSEMASSAYEVEQRLQALRGEVETITKERDAYQAQILSLTEEAATLKSRLNAKAEELRRIEDERNELRRAVRAKDIAVDDLNGQLRAINVEFAQLKASNGRAEELEVSLKRDIERMTRERDTLRDDLRSADEKLRAKDLRIDELAKEAQALVEQKDSFARLRADEKRVLQRQIADLQGQINNLTIERGVTQQLLKTTANRHEIEMKELREAQEKMAKREAHLQSYAANLAREKEELAAQAESLAQELRAARSLHPLRDYLDLTERELQRLEIQLKKTPVSSADRSQLEGFVDQLVEQRKFLQTVIDESQKTLTRDAERLDLFAEAQASIGLPPLPPMKR